MATETPMAAGPADLITGPKPCGILRSQKTEYTIVAGSARQTILDYSGSGYVSSLFIAMHYTNEKSVDAGVINIYYDGEATPTISTTIPQFFQAIYMRGAPAPNNVFNNKFFGANYNGTINSMASWYSMLPIPFSTGIKIEIVNGSGSVITLWSVATLQTGLPNTWSRTRKLTMSARYIDAPSANSTHEIVNVGGKGRLVGLWMLTDDSPHAMNPVAAEWEGNFRFYIDLATKVWSPSTQFVSGDVVIDRDGNKQTVTTPGSSGDAEPTWNPAAGSTTTDGTVVWTQTPGAPNQVWRSARPFELDMSIVDGNGCVQRVTTAGTTGSSVPSFESSPGGTTVDGTVTWTNDGNIYAEASYQSSGAEDYFMMGFYGAGTPAMFSNNGFVGTTFCNESPLSFSSPIRSFYRYHVDDPIAFDSSLVISWQAGDTSQMSWKSGSPRVWINAYYYTE